MAGLGFAELRGMIQCATAASSKSDANLAVQEAVETLKRRVGSPSLVIVSTTVGYDVAQVHGALKAALGEVKFMGGTSCGGVMTDEGFFGVDGRALGLFAIADDAGDFGVGSAPLGTTPREAAREAMKRALADAGCEGQLPTAVWMMTTPGGEEDVVLGIADVVGDEVPLVGGSAADNTLEGHWRQLVAEGVKENHVVVAALFPSGSVATSFHSGYDATTRGGVITAAEGRLLKEIDGRPASGVYNDWTGGAISDVIAKGGGELLARSNLFPIGRPLREVRGVHYFVLSHPERAFGDGSMHLFTDVKVGEAMVCMNGSVSDLVARAGNVISSALSTSNRSLEEANGALIIFCGGCFLTVRERIGEVYANIKKSLGDLPFLSTFTFGEQGRIADIGNRHGNLMIATLMLTA